MPFSVLTIRRCDVTIRRAEKMDVDAIRALDVASFCRDQQYDCQFYDTLWGRRYHVYVCEKASNGIIAYALVDFIAEPVRLRSMAVRAEFHELGIGTKLLRHVVARVPHDIDLFVDTVNLAAQRLYERCGCAFVPMPEGSSMQLTMRLSC